MHLLASLVVVLNAILGSGAAVVCLERDQVARVEWTFGAACCAEPLPGAPSSSPSVTATGDDHDCGPCTDARRSGFVERTRPAEAPLIFPAASSTWERSPPPAASAAPGTCAAASLVPAPLPRVERPFVLRT